MEPNVLLGYLVFCSILLLYFITIYEPPLHLLNLFQSSRTSYSNINVTNHTGHEFESILCTEIDFNGSSIITNDILHCKKSYTDIISVFGGYCNDLTLFRFYRLLVAQTFLSTSIPKYIFILIHNTANSTMCYGNDKTKYLYDAFILFIKLHFNVNIFLEFKPNLMNAAETRNYLIQMVVNQNIIFAQKFENIVISFFDNDDISHPQRFQVLQLLYTNKFINGTVLHKYNAKACREYTNLSQKLEYKRFFDQLSLYLNNTKLIKTKVVENIYSFFHNFSVIYQSNYLLNEISFKFYANLNETKLSHWSYNKFRRTHRYVLPRPYGQYSNGWLTTVLFNAITNKFNISMVDGSEDVMFNRESLNCGFDFYLCPIPLGIYCQGAKHFR